MSCVVAIVGRPNVGKSTLFNRLARSRDALVDNQPGVTRDRLYAAVHWEGRALTLVDTGGFEDVDDSALLSQVREQVSRAIQEADRVIFMADGVQGPLPGDLDMAARLRASGKPFYVAVNKIDGPEHEDRCLDFYSLGVDKVHPVSAAHGYGLRALMEEVTGDLPEAAHQPEGEGRIRIAVVGRPNAGKSSLINRVLGSERLLVSESPGTTRDSVDTPFTLGGREYLLIDTAGIRRKGRVRDKLDRFSMIKALRSLDRCHVAVVLLDAAAGVAEQDARICGYALERGRALVLGLNKWDLVRKDPEAKRRLTDQIERQLQFAAFAPRINLSAQTGERVLRLFDRVDVLYEQFCRRIGTGALNRWLQDQVARKPPPRPGRGSLKLFYVTQTGTAPPTFVLFANRPEAVHFSYQRFLVNRIREHFGLTQTPIKLIFRKREGVRSTSGS